MSSEMAIFYLQSSIFYLLEGVGEARLIETLQRHRGLSPTDIISAVFDEVRHFSPQEQSDDVTLIVGRCRAGASPH